MKIRSEFGRVLFFKGTPFFGFKGRPTRKPALLFFGGLAQKRETRLDLSNFRPIMLFAREQQRGLGLSNFPSLGLPSLWRVRECWGYAQLVHSWPL